MTRTRNRARAKPGSGRAGFTVVEVLVVALLGAVVFGLLFQVLVANQRAHTGHREQVAGHGTVRAGLGVLSAELREISPSDGDILDMDDTSMEVRVMRSLAFICEVDDGLLGGAVTLREGGGSWEAGDPVFIFAENDPNASEDDVWLEDTIDGVEQDQECPDGTGGRTRLTMLNLASMLDDNHVHEGAPLRSYDSYRYGLMDFDGETYLGREHNGDSYRIVGPLEAEEGLSFEYFDEEGDPTVSREAVRRIDVTLHTRSDATNRSGDPITRTLSTSIYTRN